MHRFPLILFLFTLLAHFSCSKNKDHAQSCDAGNADTLSISSYTVKGWEIYAWPGCGDWNYSLLFGTNSLKNYDEVTGRQTSARFVISVWGKAGAKKMISRIPPTSQVTLIGPGWLQLAWGAGTYHDLALPPANVITELQQAAVQAGLSWQVAN